MGSKVLVADVRSGPPPTTTWVASPGADVTPQTPQFGTSVRVVEVYASVTDAKGEPIRGLGRDQFTVLEDGRPQEIGTFIEAEFPLSLAIAVDRGFINYPFLARHDPFFEDLRGDPRFQRLLQTVRGRWVKFEP